MTPEESAETVKQINALVAKNDLLAKEMLALINQMPHVIGQRMNESQDNEQHMLELMQQLLKYCHADAAGARWFMQCSIGESDYDAIAKWIALHSR